MDVFCPDCVQGGQHAPDCLLATFCPVMISFYGREAKRPVSCTLQNGLEFNNYASQDWTVQSLCNPMFLKGRTLLYNKTHKQYQWNHTADEQGFDPLAKAPEFLAALSTFAGMMFRGEVGRAYEMAFKDDADGLE